METIRVLIADDSEMMRRQIRGTLEQDRDIEICTEAENGIDAVRKAQQFRPDLAVLDVYMPVMNGLEATQAIKALIPNLPVLIFTLHDSHQIRIESERAGADAVLMKAEGSVRLARTIYAVITTPGLSLALIGNASGQTFGAEGDLDPRRFR